MKWDKSAKSNQINENSISAKLLFFNEIKFILKHKHSSVFQASCYHNQGFSLDIPKSTPKNGSWSLVTGSSWLQNLMFVPQHDIVVRLLTYNHMTINMLIYVLNIRYVISVFICIACLDYLSSVSFITFLSTRLLL